MKFADLHLHTLYSDGTYTPQELVNQASKNGLYAFSVVDHDTIDAIEPTMEAAKEAGLEVISGIELSAEYQGMEVHMLGYLIDHKNDKLVQRLRLLKERRVDRIYKIVEKLKDMGVNLEATDVFAIARGASVGRLHVARALFAKGYTSSVMEAFHKYIGEKDPAYVCNFRFSPGEAINLVKEVGGIPVVAHPYCLGHDNERLMLEFVKNGLMGLEVYYPEHTRSMINSYLAFARRFDLLVTGGSDCHGAAKPEVKIGSIKIPYDLVQRLKDARKRA